MPVAERAVDAHGLAHFDAGVAYEALSNQTADHRESVAAFQEKREAVFKINGP